MSSDVWFAFVHYNDDGPNVARCFAALDSLIGVTV